MSRFAAVCTVIAFALTACGNGQSQSSFLAPLGTARNAPDRMACPRITARRPHAPAYGDTTWPSEHYDTWRTHAVAAGLPSGLRALRARSVALPSTPVWGYVGLDGNIYVLGGAPFLLDVFTKLILGSEEPLPKLIAESLRYSKTVTPYIARIDPETMAVSLLRLTEGSSVNYTGGLLIDSNGYIYAVARSVLYKIYPKTFTIVRSRRLPLAPKSSGEPNQLTAYNGMQATTDGYLILKGFAALGGKTGIIVKVDPNDLSIRARFESKQLASPRMAVATVTNHQYVYVPGGTHSARLLIGSNSFTLDDKYRRRYLYPRTGDTAASSDVFMGRGVIFTNNTIPSATSPMSIFAQGAGDVSKLRSTQAFYASTAGWNFFMAVGDPFKTGIAAVQNQVDGHIAGFAVCSGGINVKKLWENDAIDGSAGMAIDDATAQLYADDHRCTKGIACELFFVVLDLRTGKEIARIAVAGTKPTIGQIFIAPKGRVFYLATDTDNKTGYISRISAP